MRAPEHNYRSEFTILPPGKQIEERLGLTFSNISAIHKPVE